MGFGRELSVRQSVRVSELVELLSSRGSTELTPKSHAEVRTGVGLWGSGVMGDNIINAGDFT